ncbi:F-box/LRR-repeat protein [Trifolium medium]|uniref:F-box/LRR-repeat protein n=1 Tax=Trifolium medium TaxID=97028 RepID=A0A392LYY3_9FABA|nr:F-box/LRR-repeat protein [Trifolium medium]
MLKILHNEEISSYYKSFPVFGNLTILHLCWRFEPEVIHDWDEVVKMLQNCPKLQTLKIVKMGKMQISSYYNFPVFGNLTSLHLSWWYELEGIHIHDWDEVVKMLQNCPKLQILKIVKGGMSTTKEGWKNPCLIPECVSSNLRTCKIESYKAVKDGKDSSISRTISM